MATAQMSPPSVTVHRPVPSPRDSIIAAARSAPAPARGAVLLTTLSAGLLWGSFTPLDLGPLAWIALVPLLMLVRLPQRTRFMYPVVYLGGLAFWIPTLQWMRLGDPSMYIAWLALAAYLAAYYPVFMGLSRVAVHKLRVPSVLAVPVVWVGLEYVRAYAMTGFSWYYLAHTQYRFIPLIQISDLVGAYGVSFVIAAVAMAIAEFVPVQMFIACNLLPPAPAEAARVKDRLAPRIVAQGLRVTFCLSLFGATLVYGLKRRDVDFLAGPRVAAVQGNVPTGVGDNHDWGRIYLDHRRLTGQAVKLQPDVVIWPETMFSWPLFEKPADLTAEQLHQIAPDVPAARWSDDAVHKELASLSQQAGAALIIGLQRASADQHGMQFFNSAVFVRPDTGVAGHYDKMHRVPFGEYLPLSEQLPFLGKFSPYRGTFGIQAGQHPAAFEYKGFHYAPIICFEDTVPHLVREVVAAGQAKGEKVDVLVNQTNDGWFHGSSELDQHLITATFRCVECRTPMVRAVNTGISAIIDGDGVIRKKAVDAATGRSKQVAAFVADHVPVDPRVSLYVRYGDWFAGLCLGLCGAIVFMGLLSLLGPRRAVTA